MEKKVLIVNWGTPSAEYPLREATSLSRYDIYLAATKNVPASIIKLFPTGHQIITNPYSISQLVRDVKQFSKRNNIQFDIVTTFFEMSVLQTAYLAEALKIKHRLPVKNAHLTSQNKLKMRNCLKKAGIDQPRYITFDRHHLEKAYAFLHTIRQPIILKPIHSGHSYGAQLIQNSNISYPEFTKIFNRAYTDMYRNYDEWMGYEDKKNIAYLAEEYVAGSVYSINGIVGRPNNIIFISSAEFTSSPPPYFHQIGHTTPIASLSENQIKTATAYVQQIIKSIGLQYCGFHCELKFKHNQPLLIEISGRLPGGGLLPSIQNTSPIHICGTFLNIFTNNKVIKKNKYFASECVENYFLPYTHVFIKSIKLPSKINVPHQIEHRNLWQWSERINQNRSVWIYKLTTHSSSLAAKDLHAYTHKIMTMIKIIYHASEPRFFFYEIRKKLSYWYRSLIHV